MYLFLGNAIVTGLEAGKTSVHGVTLNTTSKELQSMGFTNCPELVAILEKINSLY